MAKADERGELIGYMENGGFVGIDNHQMIAEPLKVSVNKPLTGLPTEHSQRIHGERIEIWKKKMGAHINPQGEMSAVKKEWKGVQKPLKAEEGEISSPSRRYEPEYPSQPSAKGLTPVELLKNMIDNLDRRVQGVSNWGKAALFLGGIGLCGFLLALALVFK
jgi:hypothetical protein